MYESHRRGWHTFVLDISRLVTVLRAILKFAAGPLLRKLFRFPPLGATTAERIRLALEELGITYLKLGQYMATRFDILPRDVYVELNRLFENVAPLTYGEVTAVIESELHRPPEEIFAFFDQMPIASASVAQVHEARSHSGERLAVKIQRPGVEELFLSDVRNLDRLAAVADAMSLLGNVSSRDLISEFRKWTLRELDFRLEGQTAQALRDTAVPNVIVPKINWELTTAKVLTMEFLGGVSHAKIADLIDAGKMDVLRILLPNMNVVQACRNLSNAVLHQFFITGLFHGDPHPGNILIRDDNTVGFVDFGIFGELTDYQQRILARHVENIALGNVDESFRYFSSLVFPTDETDPRNFAIEAKSVLRRLHRGLQNPSAPIGERHLGKYSGEMFDVIRRNRLRMSTDTLLFWRALNTLESSAVRLSAHFDFMAELRGFFERTRPSIGERILHSLSDEELALNVHHVGRTVAKDSSDVLDDVFRGQLKWVPNIWDSRQRRRRNDSATKMSAGAIVGASLTILTIHSTGSLRVLSVAAGLGLFVFIATEWSKG
jgi:ubiquinone biosynthesis protein